MKTKLKGKYVIGYDGEDHVILEDAEVVYENDTIVYVGKNYLGQADKVIDAGNALISPGFIDLNALGDIDHDILHMEASTTRQKNLLWSERYVEQGHREIMTGEEEAFKSLYAYSQLILHGITTAMPITSVHYKRWAETYEELASAASHAASLGLRIYLGPSYQSGVRVVQGDGNIKIYWDEEAGRKGLERAVKFVEEFDGSFNGLVRGMLAPERIECQTEESLIQTKHYSDKLGVPIKLHAAQGSFEYHTIINNHGVTPIRHLYNLGFLGSKTGIPHAHFISGYSEALAGDGDDLALLKETNTTVIHCPLIIGRHGQAMESFAKYKRAGINLALGTDTFPPDMFQNIRTGSMLSRIVDKEVEDSAYADFYRAATLGAAKFLGRDDLGRLAPGAKADIIAIDLDGFHMGILDDPIRTMIASGTGRDVKLSIINGNVVMKDRKIPNLNLDEIKCKGQKYFEKMRKGYMERDYQQLPENELLPPSFRVVDSINKG
ncbi:cytosine/adenosine deaminase-related metal-dependent hydrolase [Cytobacillus oceanisediminis]|uniref:Cytosine/adenosine deaminase-related metal-dependent hydrolase n=1 Tax=Cytobacillus oceanisediminis TaxID=665099 RepID=A0A2V2ZSN0_9BACI|nr:amidohydrolase family protein [Cytobacillus oceanisediminis]PWW25482.1 cytosine/adenosine deaminase-related metal-dependent hydrolase [Cytobacillus oceanisediminis]